MHIVHVCYCACIVMCLVLCHPPSLHVTVTCAAVGLSTASAHMLEEEESPRQQQNLTMEDSDEVVKSKPDHAHRDNPRDSPPRVGSKKSAALARLTTLKDRSEDLEVEILTREKVEEKESYIRYKLHVKVGGARGVAMMGLILRAFHFKSL